MAASKFIKIAFTAGQHRDMNKVGVWKQKFGFGFTSHITGPKRFYFCLPFWIKNKHNAKAINFGKIITLLNE